MVIPDCPLGTASWLAGWSCGLDIALAGSITTMDSRDSFVVVPQGPACKCEWIMLTSIPRAPTKMLLVWCFQYRLLTHMHKRTEQFRLQIQYSWKCVWHQDMSYVTKRYLSVPVETRIIIIDKPLIYCINLCMHKTLYSLRHPWNLLRVSMAPFYSFKYSPQPSSMRHGSTGVNFQCVEQCLSLLSSKRCFLLSEESCVFTKSFMNPEEPRVMP